MPCYYTGSAEGDRALAAEEAISNNYAPLITELTEMLCACCHELFREPKSQIELADNPISSSNLPQKVKDWWKEHQKIDEKIKNANKY